jgi:predicted PurR-regulated permease PerM
MVTDSTKLIKTLLLLVLVFAILVIAKKFIIPFTFGIVLAMLFMPMCQWLENRKVPKLIATLMCIAVILLVFSGIAAMLSWQLNELSQDATQIKQQISQLITQAHQFIATRLGVPKEKQMEILEQQQKSMSSGVSNILSSLGYTLVDCLLGLVYIALMLFYRGHLKNFMLKLAPESQKAEAKEIIYKAAKVSQQYLLGLAKMIVCLWVMYSIGFSIAGVKNAFFFAFLCGLLEIVPFVGNLTGSGITVLVAVTQGGGIGVVIGIVITYGFVQFLQGWVLEPLIVGPQVKINPLFTIVALVIGELMWGIPGMVLAIPITGMLKIVFDHVEPLKPYGFLIGEVDETKKESAIIATLKKWWAKIHKLKQE